MLLKLPRRTFCSQFTFLCVRSYQLGCNICNRYQQWHCVVMCKVRESIETRSVNQQSTNTQSQRQLLNSPAKCTNISLLKISCFFFLFCSSAYVIIVCLHFYRNVIRPSYPMRASSTSYRYSRPHVAQLANTLRNLIIRLCVRGVCSTMFSITEKKIVPD